MISLVHPKRIIFFIFLFFLMPGVSFFSPQSEIDTRYMKTFNELPILLSKPS